MELCIQNLVESGILRRLEIPNCAFVFSGRARIRLRGILIKAPLPSIPSGQTAHFLFLMNEMIYFRPTREVCTYKETILQRNECLTRQPKSSYIQILY